MRHRKAFTLIEVMVVLSLLALVAVLAYSYFGSTLKDAKLTQQATLLENDLNALVQAYEAQEMATGVSKLGTYKHSDKTLYTNFSFKSELKLIDTAYTTAANELRIAPTFNLNGDVPFDMIASAYQLGSELCLKYNEKYCATCGATVPNSATMRGDKSMWSGVCFDSTGGGVYIVMKLIRLGE